MEPTRAEVEKQLEALNKRRRELVDDEERQARELAAADRARARTHLTALLAQYGTAEQERQTTMRALFAALQKWPHPVTVRFANGHLWQGSALHFPHGLAEQAMLDPLDCRVVQFDV